MSRPGFMEGALTALVLAVAGAALAHVLPPLLGTAAAWRLVVVCLAGAYLGYLLCRSVEKTGRIVVPCLWIAATLLGWTLLEPASLTLLQIALVWLIRALYYHGGVLAALADLGLSGLALAVGLWALGTGSWLLGLWSFFLVQAFFTWIPSSRPSTPDTEPDAAFEQARDLAEAALRRLAAGR